MRVFISEFVCGGGWPETEIAGSLAREGRAMLAAAVTDFAGVDGVRVTTTWDARLGPPPFENAHTIVVDSPAEELPVFRELAALSEAVLIIAPETSGILELRCRIVEGVGGRLLGPASHAVAVCASKFATFRRLTEAGVPTIPTRLAKWPQRIDVDGTIRRAAPDPVELTFPLVIKPVDGAGSQNTFLIRSAAQLQGLPPIRSDLEEGAVVQPFVPGRALSVAVLASEAGEPVHIFPPAEQTLSEDGRFGYLGGTIPARGIDAAAVQALARDACRAIGGLRGYVGIDLIVPENDPDRPIVVEINPRLTTSYIGYRQLAAENLAERMLRPDSRPIAWRDASLTFRTDE